ncbi:alpha-tocopherol transfer protein-like isoform X1 [Diabrotica undecimpunctata]|uniref:alpha-tocopherol transfer protein-like isoform X1 n=1 Tax=Diabrotica undecimpunctata TaxID=50387 RepID=UPI003B64219E
MEFNFKFKAEDMILKKRTTRENIDSIKEWLEMAKPKYVPLQLQDELIILFLLSCDNNTERTKGTIMAHFKMKKEAPEIFDGRDMYRDDIQKAFKTYRMISLPGRTAENYQILYLSLRDSDFRNFDLVPILKATYMLLDIEHDENPPDGAIYLADMKGFGFMHVFKLRPDPIRKYLHYLGEGVPVQFKGVHFINGNYFLDKAMLLVKAFLKPELFNLMKIHQKGWNPGELFPKSSLPKELGGDLESEEELCNKTIELYKEKQTFWEKEEKWRHQYH